MALIKKIKDPINGSVASYWKKIAISENQRGCNLL